MDHIVLRPRDGDALRAELRLVAQQAGVPVAFGGEAGAEAVVLTEFFGTLTNRLRELAVLRTSGLGGRVLDSHRPASVADYRNAATITHHYDGPVTGEGMRSVLAVPVVVQHRARAVIYAATRGDNPLGDRAIDLAVRAGRRLAAEIGVRDEVDRRVRMLELIPPSPAVEPAVSEELRGITTELRGMAHTAHDDQLRERLHTLSERLTRALAGERAEDAPRLSHRELDVLSHVAMGCTNQEAAQRLSLRPETVKSYLRNAMSKLDAHSRHEAVVTARRLGLLP